MPFVYSTPRNDYAGSVGELLLHGGDIEAQRAIAIANAQAAASVASGQAWGNAAQQIGQTVGSTITQLTDPRRQMEQIALKNAQDQQRGQQIVDRGLAGGVPNGPQPEGAGPAPEQHPYLDENGLADPTKISQLLQSNGLGHLAPDILKGVEAQNSSILAYKATQEQAATKHAIMLGTAANTTLNLLKTGMPFQDAVQHGSSSLVATGVLKAEDVQQAIGALGQLPPDQQIAKLQALKATAAQLGPKRTLGPDAKELDMFDEPTATNPKGEKAEKATFGLRMPDGTVQNVEGSFLPTANGGKGAYSYLGNDVSARVVKTEEPTSNEWKDVLLDGKPSKVFVDPKTKVVTTLAGTVVDHPETRIKPVPTAAQVSINAGALSDPALEQAAQQYLQTGKLPPGMGGAAVARNAKIMNRAAELDPKAALALNQATFKADSANLTNLQKTEGTLSAFENTAGKNLDQFLTLADKIPDTGVPWLNTPVRMLDAKLVGSQNMAAINAARDVALREIARVTNDPKMSGALTDSARHEIQSLVPANATLPQIKAVVKVLKQDMANVHAGLTQQIESVKSGLAGHPGATASTPRDPMGIR